MIYHRIWKSYVTKCEARRWHSHNYVLGNVLASLQTGADMHVTLSIIKGQILTLAVFISKANCFSFFGVCAFVHSVINIVPSVRTPVTLWNLNLVLYVFQRPPFEPIQDLPLVVLLIWKVVFLITFAVAWRVFKQVALSCKEPFLILLYSPFTSAIFLPKVILDFHLNQDIVLPFFFMMNNPGDTQCWCLLGCSSSSFSVSGLQDHNLVFSSHLVDVSTVEDVAFGYNVLQALCRLIFVLLWVAVSPCE